MKLNSTSQYAIKIMNHIATNNSTSLVNAKVMAEELSIPYKYLTRIMIQLIQADFIVSVRGKFGGYKLNKSAESILIIDILKSVKESIDETSCVLGIGACNKKKKCVMHDKWKVPKKSILDMFQNTTLADLEQ